jgi:hypothetical protein
MANGRVSLRVRRRRGLSLKISVNNIEEYRLIWNSRICKQIFWICSLDKTGEKEYESESLHWLTGKEKNTFSHPR